MVSQRSLHKLAEAIYEELEEDGFFDDRQSTRGRPSRGGSGGRRSQIRYQPKKRKASARSKKYGRAFKRLAPKYKKKNGSWKKDGFKRCVRAAHRACK